MKKAKDYAKQYLDNPSEGEIIKILVEIILESNELENQRGTPGRNSNEVSRAILDELHQKWIAVCNRLDNVVQLDRNAFPNMLFNHSPILKSLWVPKHWKN